MKSRKNRRTGCASRTRVNVAIASGVPNVATPAKDTVKRQEFAQLAGIPPAVAAPGSFRCIATVYRTELLDEVMDITLDRLSQAPLETELGIDHYMHGEVWRVKPDSTAFPLRVARKTPAHQTQQAESAGRVCPAAFQEPGKTMHLSPSPLHKTPAQAPAGPLRSSENETQSKRSRRIQRRLGRQRQNKTNMLW
jgi:hypothetical protein